MLNPSMIVIGGSIAEAGEQLMAGIREVVYSRSLPLATQHLRVVASRARAKPPSSGRARLPSTMSFRLTPSTRRSPESASAARDEQLRDDARRVPAVADPREAVAQVLIG